MFCVGEKQLEFTDKYMYLGFFLDESMSFLHGASVLTDSASRVLDNSLIEPVNTELCYY